MPVFALAATVSLAASAWLVPSGLSLAYGDALSHLTIARRLFDTLSEPGQSQLGTVWLPVPHLLLAPFVVVLWAWRTGWGAALLGAACLGATAAGCYRVGACWGLGLTARLVLAAVVVLNPAMVYLHSTALTEPVLIAASAGTFAGLSGWATRQRPRSPGELAVFAGAPAVVATLSRYEGWALVLAGALFVASVAWLQDRSARAVLSHVTGFAAAPIAAILWWVAYNWVVFHDPLAFLFGEYSASALQDDLVVAGLTTRGDLAASVSTANFAVETTVGVGSLALGAVAVLVLAITERSLRRWLLLGTATVTYVFMVVSLWAGEAVIFNPVSSATTIWNNRYGMATVLPVALAVGFAVDRVSARVGRAAPHWVRPAGRLLAVLVALVLVGQAAWQLELPVERNLVLAEATIQFAQRAGPRAAAEWLSSHYDGGFILLDEGVPANSVQPLAGIALREYYLRANDALFTQALTDPIGHARWLWVSDDPADAVAKTVAGNPAVETAYKVAYRAGGVVLYRRTQ